MVRKLFQYTQDPRDSANVQSVGIHDFIKKAFSRSAKHPIFEAPKESELGLSETSNQVKFNFNPTLLSEWEKADKRYRCKNDQASFLEAKCQVWGLKELDFPDGRSADDIDWEEQARVHDTASIRIESVLMLNSKRALLAFRQSTHLRHVLGRHRS